MDESHGLQGLYGEGGGEGSYEEPVERGAW